jgi:hypothetical protein
MFIEKLTPVTLGPHPGPLTLINENTMGILNTLFKKYQKSVFISHS